VDHAVREPFNSEWIYVSLERRSRRAKTLRA
jgi:hypothetical protein